MNNPAPLFVLPLYSQETPLSERETRVGGPVSSVSGERYTAKGRVPTEVLPCGWLESEAAKLAGPAKTVKLTRSRGSWEVTAYVLAAALLFQTSLFVFLFVTLGA